VTTSQTKTGITHKKRDYRFWGSYFVGIIGLGVLGYYSYCFGLWGRNSLLLQRLFQCNYPAFSEEWRYPRRVDVVVPACSYVGSILSPTGNLLYVMEGESRFAKNFASTYLLDFRTNKKTPFFIGKGSKYFLTDDLLFLSLSYGQEGYEGGEYILDRTTGKQYPIQRFRTLWKDAFLNGKLNLALLAMELRAAQDVYLIDNDIIVALKSDFQEFPERNFYIERMDFPKYAPDGLENFLQLNNIDHQRTPGFFQEEAVSPNGRFIARRDGIYLVGSNEKIVEGYELKGSSTGGPGGYFGIRGWTYESSGVLYHTLDGCLLELTGDGIPYCTFEVPQPLLLLKVPNKYLSTETP